jgi:predicted ester cyclase
MRIYDFAAAAERAFNYRDLDGIIALWAEPASYHAPGEKRAGIEALAARERGLWAGFSDLQGTMTPLGEQGDSAAFHAQMAGTHDGVVFGFEPTQRTISFEFVGMVTFEGAKVIAERVFYDRLDLAEMLGPTP